MWHVSDSFFSELEKISGAWSNYSRSIKRPISVQKLLDNEAENPVSPSEEIDNYLNKSSEINISGISPETVLKSQPQIMETPGLQKAREILSAANMDKRAGISDEAFSTAGHALGGAGFAKGLGELYSSYKVLKNQPGLTEKQKAALVLTGASLGLAVKAKNEIKKVREARKLKTANLLGGTPAMHLKAMKQVGTLNQGISSSAKKYAKNIKLPNIKIV